MDAKFKHQQQQGDRFHIPYFFRNMDISINIRMAEVKMIASIFNFFGYGIYSYTLFINLDNVKGWILMIIGSLFGLAKLYFYIVNSAQKNRMNEKDERLKEIEIKRTLNNEKAKELEMLEKELSLRITGLTPEHRKRIEDAKKKLKDSQNETT